MLEEVSLVEREAHCESTGDVGNGYYFWDLEGLFSKLEEIKIPRTREGGFRPFLIKPCHAGLL